MSGNRIAAFVSAARSLLVVQVVAALLAVGVTGWAFFEVRGLVAEREQLRARVNELEMQAAQPQQPLAPVPLGPDPLLNQVLPPEMLAPETGPVLPDAGNVVVPTTPPETTEPGNSVTPPGRWDQRPPTTQPPTTTPPRLDCAGADRANPRCRPAPERPPIQQVPDRLTPRGEPLTPQQQQPPTLSQPRPQRPAPTTRPEPRPTAQPQPRPQLQVNPNMVRPQPQTRPTPTRPRPQTQPAQPAPQQPSTTPPRPVVSA